MNPVPLPKLPPLTWQMLLMTILSIGLVVFFAVMTYRRRNWARWVHTLFFVGGLLLVIPAQTQVPSTSYVVSSMSIIVYVTQVISVALLFVRQSNAWYFTTDAMRPLNPGVGRPSDRPASVPPEHT